LGLANRFNLTYTRYADDITFSSNHYVYAEGGEFRQELERIITDQGFVINEKKTRLQKKGGRQEVTGLIVNEKTNAHRSFRKNLRAAVFAAETFGCTRKEYDSIMGRISYLSMLLNEDIGCIYKYKAIMSKVMFKK
jgi:retron-type reverse transcriptase